MPGEHPSLWRRAVPLILLLALTFGAFHNGLDGDFVFDDVHLIRDLPCARTPLEPLRGLFFAGSSECAYRPFRYLTYSFDQALHGGRAAGYHVTNLILHGVSVVLVFFLLRRLLRGRTATGNEWTGADFGALAGAAVFAIHPVQVDSVTYISGRRDILQGLFYVGAMLAYVRFHASGKRRWAFAVFGLYYLGLQSKEMAVTLPAVLVLLDVALRRLDGRVKSSDAPVPSDDRATEPARSSAATEGAPQPSGRPPTAASALPSPAGRVGSAILELVMPVRRHPWLFGALFSAAIAFTVFRGVAAPLTLHPGFWGGSRLANAATALGTIPGYARLLVWPAQLLADYSPDAYPIQSGFAGPLPLFGAALYLGLLGVAVLGWAWRPRLALAAGWSAIAMLPVLHIVPHHELMAEHYLYLPLAAIALAVACGFAWLHARSVLVASALVVALLAALGLRTLVRNEDWKNEWTLWEAELAVTDDCARVHSNYAILLWEHPERDKPDRSGLVRHVLRAIQIQERTKAGVSRIPQAELNAILGAVYAQQGRTEEGLKLLRWAFDAVRSSPDGSNADEIAETFVVTLTNLGQVGQTEELHGHLLEAQRAAGEWLAFAREPQYAHLLRGRVLHALCELDSARAAYAAAIPAQDPTRTLEAVELSVESYVEEGDLASARSFLAEWRARGLRSARLDAFAAALDSGAAPPPPRCPAHPPSGSPAEPR
jgi:tetratricopeptide (TPR) repeat protein